MDNDEKKQWMESIRAELKSFEDLEVQDEVTSDEVRTLRQRGSYPKKLPDPGEKKCPRSQRLEAKGKSCVL
eukprot:12894684-Prorocentrum_lima.AAC.1